MRLLITCEHGGNRIPREFAGLFPKSRAESHFGWDIGALELARRFATRLRAPLIACTISRLLVDQNRSESNPAIWSAPFSRETREGILQANGQAPGASAEFSVPRSKKE